MNTRSKLQYGFTVLELLYVCALVGLMSGLALLSMHSFVDRTKVSAESLVVYLKSERNLAMSRTQAVIVYPQSSVAIGRKSAVSCSDASPIVESFSYRLPHGIALGDTSWSICFTSRGLSNASQSFSVNDSSGTTRHVEISLGGSVRML